MDAPFSLSTRTAPPAEAPTPADLVIALGEPRAVPAAPPPGEVLGAWEVQDRLLQSVARLADGAICLRIPGHLDACFTSALSACTLHADPAAPPGYLTELVSGPVLAVWLLLTGRPSLHASAVAIDGAAVAFVGNSGGGKSTLAGALITAGAIGVTDDIARPERVDRGWVCHAGPGRLRLREGAAVLARGFDHAEATADGRLAVTVPSVEAAVVFGALVIPQLDPAATAVSVERVAGARAVTELMARPRVGSLLGGEFSGVLFRLCAELADAVPVWRLTVPWGDVDAGLGGRLLPVVAGLVNR